MTIELINPILPEVPSGKDEMNFAEFGIALLTDRVPKGQKSIEFEDEIYDDRRKKKITRRRVIQGSEKYGLPTATDDTVILALIQLTKLKSNFKHREVEFTRLELIKLLGWPNEGKNYDRLKLSLLRIANVTYNYDNAWWDSRQKTWTTKAFHIIDTVEINDSRATAGQAGLFPSRIVWGDVVFDSFQSGFLRNIDFQLCMQLQHPIALRMYRFLGKRFYHSRDLVFDLKEFAYGNLSLGRNYEGGAQIARKLQPAIQELESIGFLEPLPENQRYQKKGWEWTIRFIRQDSPLSGELSPSSAPATSPVEGELIAHGVAAPVAAELIRTYGEVKVQQQIEILEWRLAGKQANKIIDPAAFLVGAIRSESGYAAPKGFVSRAERQRKEEAKATKANAIADEARRQASSNAQQRAERARVATYWDSLSTKQQADLDTYVIANASPETQQNLNGKMGKLGLQILREEHITTLLKQESELSTSSTEARTPGNADSSDFSQFSADR